MESLEKTILQIIDKKQPKNVKELIQLVQEQSDASADDIKREIKNLQQRELITLEEAAAATSPLSSLLSSRKNLWFWVTVTLTLVALTSILFIPEAETPLSYVRYALGLVLAIFLPGYCLTETLFPKRNTMDAIERLTLSIGLSFAVTAIVGLFLSFTPFRLTLATALLTLSSIVIVLAIAALIRRQRAG
jgi:uncharacterized membrane protein